MSLSKAAQATRWLVVSLPLVVVGLPVVAGFIVTLYLSFGGVHDLVIASRWFDSWLSLFNDAGFWSSNLLTLWTAWGSTLLALGLAICLAYWLQHSRIGRSFTLTLPVFLSVPHAAFAVGFAFLISPSGWLSRLFSPWLTSWQRPPDIATVQDPFGLALLIGLAIKEIPFLLLMLLASLGQTQHLKYRLLGASMGYSPWRSWWVLTVPLLYRQIRLPLLVVFAYSLSVVDMAKVLAPSIPNTLAVKTSLWLYDPDPSVWPVGAASALWLLVLAIGSVALWYCLERLMLPFIKRQWVNGKRRGVFSQFIATRLIPPLWITIMVGSVVVIVIWSLTWRWQFPDAFPEQFGLRLWQINASVLLAPAWNTVSAALASTLFSVMLAILLLEAFPELKRLQRWQLAIFYVPLLLPQLAFLFGIQLLLLNARLDGQWWALVWVHSVFVLPYVMLSLIGPWREWDERYRYVGLSLGQSEWQVFRRIKLPLLLRPLCYAAAIGFSVSVAQYLSTLFVGAGRFPTLTTEAIALSSGGDRRQLAALALMQLLLPMIAFGLAFLWPRIQFKNFRGMRHL